MVDFFKFMYKVIFENENLLVVEKPQGVVCEPDEGDPTCLIDEVKVDYGEACELCHRLDRNTGGLILIARNKLALDTITDEIKNHRMGKYYRGIFIGKFEPRFGKGDKFVSFKAYHFKDAKKGTVYIYDIPKKFSKTIVTEIRPLRYNPETNTQEAIIHLVTGRTHQIRAHLAYLGHPVAGDGKYGKNSDNRKLKYKYQALWSYRLEISPKVAKDLGIPETFESKPFFK